VIVRIVVYGAAFSYFGWGAFQRWQAERKIELEAETPAMEKREIMLPDGTVMPVFEITEAEFEAQFGQNPAKPSGQEASAKADPSARPSGPEGETKP
jgi:hypothetical protein